MSANTRSELQGLVEGLRDPVRLRFALTALVLLVGYLAVYQPLTTRLDATIRKLRDEQKLDSISVKTNRVFNQILADLFADDELLPRLRRLFWLEATKAERDFNNHIVKPMLRQHDRKLYDEALRAAMEMDLESVSDMEELMRVWEGLHKLELEMIV